VRVGLLLTCGKHIHYGIIALRGSIGPIKLTYISFILHMLFNSFQ